MKLKLKFPDKIFRSIFFYPNKTDHPLIKNEKLNFEMELNDFL
jgi:hypothetical protein